MDVLVGPTFSVDVSSYGPAQTQDSRHRAGLYLNQDRGAAVAEEASSDSSSSIGVPDDSEEEEDFKGDDGDEVQSKFNGGGGSGGGLGSMGSFGSLEESLPIKRGLSNYFSGKSKSFASLSEVCSSVSSVKEVEKRDNPFNKRRRVLIASKWSRKSSSSSSLYNWPNPKSMPLLALAEEGDEDDDEEQNRFEEGMLWLPSQVLDEAICDTKAYSRLHVKHHHYHSDQLDSKSSSMRPYHRPKVNVNWSSGGPGMQAIFLDSSQKACGTGVFLPQRAGTHFIRSKKPACAPVLLPSRVVQALNLNVHALGLQISPRQDSKEHKWKSEDYLVAQNRNGNKDGSSTQCYIISQNPNSSPELFLPKEWTY